jgi:hypothetical protein
MIKGHSHEIFYFRFLLESVSTRIIACNFCLIFGVSRNLASFTFINGVNSGTGDKRVAFVTDTCDIFNCR